MAEVKWIKIVTDIFDDEKMLLIESLPSADSLIVIWFKLLCFAGKNNNNGVFLMNNRVAYTDEMLATVFRRDVNTVRLALRTFEEYGMIEIIEGVITIPNWGKHQTLDSYERKKERDRVYQAERRAKQKALIEKSSDKSSDVAISDIDKDKDIEIDKDITPLPPLGGTTIPNYDFDKHSNLENVKHTLNTMQFKDWVFIKENPELWQSIKDWMEYKDQKKPRNSNHYVNLKSMCMVLKKFVDNSKKYGVDLVVDVVNESMSKTYQGIVWDRLEKAKKETKSGMDSIIV